MKCPKCGYLGFEQAERCRNCGYDFSLVRAPDLLELSIRSDSPESGPFDDLALADAGMSSLAAAGGTQAQPAAVPRRAGAAPSELPLFGSLPIGLTNSTRPPRAPLAVRRATADTPRLRPEPVRGQGLELDLDPLPLPGPDPGPASAADPAFEALGLRELPDVATTPRIVPDAVAPQPVGSASVVVSDSVQDAGVISRAIAALIDLCLLAAIDLAVVYFTVQICGITLAELGVVPKGPLVAFLFVQNGGYLVAFTAGGQTLGKLAARIKVVAVEPRVHVDLGHAIVRTFLWALLVLPVGLGFLTALFRKDRRGLHDRVAGTRVVRATA